jgi:hypothetical protein
VPIWGYFLIFWVSACFILMAIRTIKHTCRRSSHGLGRGIHDTRH